MRHTSALGVLAVLLPLICVKSAAAADTEEIARLKAKVAQLEAENKSLREQVAKFTGQVATPKKPLAKKEIGIEIDSFNDISIEGNPQTLTSIRELLDSAPPSVVVVRTKPKAAFGDSLGLQMAAFLKRHGYQKDEELGNEQSWVQSDPAVAAQRKPLAKAQVVIEIDAFQDISIGGKAQTLSSIRGLLEGTSPSVVVVRTKPKASFSDLLGQKMEAFLQKQGYQKDDELGCPAPHGTGIHGLGS